MAEKKKQTKTSRKEKGHLDGEGGFSSGHFPINQISERKRAEESLRKSEERFRVLMEATSEALYHMSPDWKEVRQLHSHSIFASTDKTSHSWLQDYIPPDEQPRVIAAINEAIRNKSVFQLEHRVLRLDGTIGWTFSRAVPLFNAEGEIQEWFGAASDITERKRTEEALRESEARLSAIFQSAEEAILTLDREQRVFRANRAAGVITGIPQDQLIGRSLAELVDPSFYIPSAWEKFLKIGRLHGEIGIRHIDGSLRIVLVSGIANIGVGQHLFIAHDITERKNMEEKLRKSRDDLEVRVKERTAQLEKEIEKRTRFEEMLRASAIKMSEEAHKRRLLSARLVDLLEKDRRDLAMALHDQLGQFLTTLKMDIEMLEGGNDRGVNREALARAREKTAGMMALVRDISQALRPPALDTAGVTATLEALVVELKRNSGTDIIFFHSNIPKTVGKDRALSLYRIAQEALTNALKHASAEHVFVNLIHTDGVLSLTVEDDGRGFDQSAIEILPSGPLGIEIMKERARDAGGSLRIESQPGRGTQVIAEIPIDMAGDEPEP